MRILITLLVSILAISSSVQAKGKHQSRDGGADLWFWSNAFSKGNGPDNCVEHFSGSYYGKKKAHSCWDWWCDDDEPTDEAPAAVIYADPLEGYQPLKVWFSAKLSEDDYGVSNVSWDFGDSSSSSQEALWHEFAQPGNYTVALTVWDAAGQSDTETTTVTVLPLPKERVVEGLLAYYDFSSGAGDTVFDRSDTGDPIDLLMDDPTKTAWLECGGLALKEPTTVQSFGSADKIISSVKHSHEITVELWIDPADAQPGVDGVLFQIATVGPNNAKLDVIRWDDLYRVRYRSKSNGKENTIYSPAGSADSELTHIVFTREHRHHKGRLYINGERVATAKMTGTIFSRNEPYTVGLGADLSDGSEPWLGDYFLSAVYERALSEDEVMQNYLAGLPSDNNVQAVIAADPVSGDAPLTVNFSAGDSASCRGAIIDYAWDFGDGATGSGVSISHEYLEGGLYEAVLTVAADDGTTASSTVLIDVAVPNLPPAISIQSPVSGQTYTDAELPTFAALATDSDGSVSSVEFFLDGSSIGNGTFNATTGFYELTLTAPLSAQDDVYLLAALVTDDNGATGLSQDVGFRVESANEAPTVEDVTLTMIEDGILNWSMTGQDANGDALTLAIVDAPASGELLNINQEPGQNILTGQYVPPANAFGEVTFTYEASDGQLSSNLGTVTVQVQAVNDAPTGSLPPVTVAEDSDPTIIDLLSAFSDVDDGAASLSFSVLSNSNPSLVTPSIAGSTLSLLYAADAEGASSVVIRATDPLGDYADATFAVTVSSVNDAPVITSTPLTSVDEDTLYSYAPVANDVDAGDVVTITATALPTWLSFDGMTLSGTPTNDEVGEHDVVLIATDDAGDSATQGFTITVINVNDAPVAGAASFTTDEDLALSGNLSGSDDDGDSLTFAAATQPAHGALAVNPDGSFSYTPVADYHGPDSFTFTVSDAAKTSMEATINLTVNPINDLPVATVEPFTVEEDTATPITINASDVDGDTLSSTILAVSGGTLTGDLLTGYTFTPDDNFYGPASVEIEISDGNAGVVNLVENFTINPVNDAPVADTLSVETDEDAPVAITLTGSDIEKDALTYAIVNATANGNLSGSAPNLTYKPDENFHGDDSFTFTINDGAETSAPATVTITVNPVNDAPAFTSAPITVVNEDAAYSYVVTAEDVDEGDAVTITAQVLPTWLSFDGTTLSGTPTNAEVGDHAVTLTATDLIGAIATQSFSITVNDINNAPIAISENLQIDEDTVLESTLSGSDSDGDSLIFELASSPQNGALIVGQDGVFTYTPAPNFNGSDTFDFTVSDGLESSSLATISITVNPINDAPTALAQAFEVDEDSSIDSSLVANDVEGDTLSFSLDTPVSNGTINLSADGSFTYIPDNDFNGTDNFTYTVSDGLLSSSQTASLSVNPVNDTPFFVSSAQTTANENELYEYSVVVNDVDADDILTVTAISIPSWLNFDGSTLSGLPDNDDIGSHDIMLIVTDEASASSAQSFTITVNDVNIGPVITSQPITDTHLSFESDQSVIVATVRDFLVSHPDMQSATNISVTQGLVESALGTDKKPILSATADPGEITSEYSFNQWYRDVPGVNETTFLSFELSETSEGSGIYTFSDDDFFPINGRLLDYGLSGVNRYFTLEFHSEFTYQGGEIFEFTGDDDVWVFIDNDLVVDIGGVHTTANGLVNLDTLGLTVGETYDFDFFFAERQCCGSTFRIDTGIQLIPDETYRYPVQASDSDGDILTFELITGPPEMEIDPASGLLSWTPSAVGSYPVSVRVFDASGAEDIQSFNLVVSEGFDAATPRFVSYPVTDYDYYATDLNPDPDYIYNVIAEDPDADDFEIRYALIERPQGMTIDEITGRLYWDIQPEDVGSHLVVVGALDLDGNLGTQEFVLNISATNFGPIVDAGSDIFRHTSGDVIDLAGGVSDPDTPAAQITASWSLVAGDSSNVVLTNTTDIASTQVQFTAPGTYLLAITASDGIATSRDYLEARIDAPHAVYFGDDAILGFFKGDGTAVDTVSGQSAAFISETGYGQGKINLSYGFSGDFDFLRIANRADLDLRKYDGFTVEFWMKPTTLRDQPIVIWNDGVADGLTIYEDSSGNGIAFTSPHVGGGSTFFRAGQGLSAGIWSHVAVTYDRALGTVSIFIDGEQRATQHVGDVDFDTAGAINLGHSPAGLDGGWYRGTLDEIAFYQRALTAEEITAIVEAGETGKGFVADNAAPVVDAGSFQYFRTSDSFPLAGVAQDDELPEGLDLKSDWTVLSGNTADLAFSDQEAVSTTLTANAEGRFLLKLSASDGQFVATDTVEIRIDQLYSTLSEGAPIAYWSFNNHSVELFNETETTLHSLITYVDGVELLGARFDGSFDIIETASADLAGLGAQDGFSASFWMAPNLIRDQPILTWNDGSDGLQIFQDQSGSGLAVDLGPNSKVAVGGFLSANQWDHIVVTYSKSSGQIKIYNNGSIRYTASVGNITPDTLGKLYIGHSPVGLKGRFYAGSLDELAIFNAALSPSDVAAIYADGINPLKGNQYPTVFAGRDATIETNLDFTLFGQYFDDGAPNPALAVGWEQVGGPESVVLDPLELNPTLNFTTAGLYTFKLIADDANGLSTDTIDVRVGIDCSLTDFSGDVIWMPFNDTLSDLVSDVTVTSVGGSFVEGKVASGYNFSAGEYLSINSPLVDLSSYSGFTVEFWVKPDRIQDQPILTWNDGADGLVIFQDNNGRGIAVRPFGSGSKYGYSGAMSTSIWNHIAVTYDRTSGRLKTYENGVQKRNDAVGNINFDTAGSLLIGRSPGQVKGEWFDGKLDEIGIYERALTVDEVLALVASGANGRCPPAAANASPVVFAGIDQNFIFTNNPLIQQSSFFDDGLPANASITAQWTQLSGPAGVSFSPVSIVDPAADLDTAITFPGDGVYELQLSVSDGEAIGTDTMTVTVTTPVNEAPSVDAGEAQVIAIASGAQLTGFVDDDGLPSGTLSHQWFKISGPGDVAVDDPFAVSTFANFSKVGVYVLELRANDGSLTSSDFVTIEVVHGPFVQIASPADGESIEEGVDVIITAFANDADGSVDSIELFLNSASVGEAGLIGQNTYSLNLGALSIGQYEIHAIATDNDGFTFVTAKRDFIVLPQGGADAPDARIESPASDSVITAPTPIIGTVTSSILKEYRFQYRLKGETDWQTAFTGTTEAASQELGTFDPTLLLNGIYEVRLQAEDLLGRTITDGPISFIVDGNMKVGHLELQYQDLQANLPGLPLTVTRHYDTKRAMQDGDFGYGWSLSITDVSIQKNRSLAYDWYMDFAGGLTCPLFLTDTASHIVTVTFANGESHAFYGVAVNSNTGGQCFSSAGLGTPASLIFEPLAGEKGMLEVKGENLGFLSSANGPVQLFDIDDGSDFDPVEFVYTAVDGVQYHIHEDDGLTYVEDRHGNSITIDENGYHHSSGQSIAFTRNADGRIGKITDPAGTELSYFYDANGDLVAFTDRAGFDQFYSYHPAPNEHHLLEITGDDGVLATRNEYDEEGRLSRVVDANGQVTTYTYDLTGRSQTVRDRLGRETTIVYNERGNVTSKIAPDGGITQIFYEDPNNPDRETKIIDPLGTVSTATYDPDTGRVLATTEGITDEDPVGFTTTYAYDDPANPHLKTAVTDPRGNTTNYVYDAAGNMTSMTDALGNVTRYTYDAEGNQTSKTDALGNKVEWEYSAYGLPIVERRVAPDGTIYSEVFKTYDVDVDADNNGDPDGNGIGVKIAESMARTNYDGSTTDLNASFSYDGEGKLLSIVYSDGTSTSQSYNENDKIVQVIDEAGQVVDYIYDNRGNLLETQMPGGVTITSTYDAAGQILSTSNPNGDAATYSYDSMGRITSFSYPDGSSSTQTYDLLGRMVSEVDELGRTITYEYDARGNLLERTHADGTSESYFHDENGNRVALYNREGMATLFEYDELNRLVRTEFIGEVDAQGLDLDPSDNAVSETVYDAIGQVSMTIDPRGNVTEFVYDNDCGCKGRQTSYTDALGRNITKAYDELGNKVSETDAAGNTTFFAYDARQRLETVINQDGTQIDYQYDVLGRRTREVDELGHVTDFDYDPFGRVTNQRRYLDYAGVGNPITTNSDRIIEQTFTYSNIGLPLTQSDPNGNVSSFEYDELGRRTKVTDALGRESTFDYDEIGNLVSQTDALGRITSFEHDINNYRFRTTYADGGITETAYDAFGRQVSTVDPLDNETSFAYDAQGRLLQITDELGQTTQYEYDASGNQTKVIDALGRETVFVYDAANQLIERQLADGSTQSFEYDDRGLVSKEVDQNGNAKAFSYDVRGRLLSITELDENDNPLAVTAYEYDDAGRRTAQVDGLGRRTEFTYDALGRLLTKEMPGGEIESYAYDAASNLVTRTDANGYATTYIYDELNRLIEQSADSTHPSLALSHVAASIDYVYDEVGRMTYSSLRSAEAFGETVLHEEAFTYDSRDRLTLKSTPDGNLSYTYDVASNLTSLSSNNPNGVHVAYGYDGLNRLQSVTDNAGFLPSSTVHTYAYTQVGSMDQMTYANGIRHEFTYDQLNRLTDLEVRDGSTLVQSYGYTLSPTGQKLAVTESTGRDVAWNYDDRNQLVREIVADDPFGQNGAVDYTYDDAGNRKTRSSSIPSLDTQSFNYTVNDRIVGYSYDANGNTTAGPASESGYTDVYDFRDKLVRRTKSDGTVVDISYDAAGNRIGKVVSGGPSAGSTTLYLIDGNSLSGFAQVVEELSWNGSAFVPHRSYVYGLGLIAQHQWLENPLTQTFDWETSYYHYDGQGSVRALSDETGLVTDSYDYDAFGNLLRAAGTTPNNYLYQGQQFDGDLGLYYLRARYLDTDLGRFHTADPFDGFADEPLSLHKYLYAFNDPVNLGDPSGYFPMSGFGMLSYFTAYVDTLSSYTNLIMFYYKSMHRSANAHNLAQLNAALDEFDTTAGSFETFLLANPVDVDMMWTSFVDRAAELGEEMKELAWCVSHIIYGTGEGFVETGWDTLKTFGQALWWTGKTFFKYSPTTPWGAYNTIKDGPQIITQLNALWEGINQMVYHLTEKVYNNDWMGIVEGFSPDLYTVLAWHDDELKVDILRDDYCLAVGRLIGGVGFEVVMTVATAGAGHALKAVKCSKLAVGAVTKLDNVAPDSSITRFLKRNTGCFVAGTLVWSTAGAVPIEDLALGDAILTDAEAAQHEVINEQPDRSIEVKLSLAEADRDRFDMQSIVSSQWLEAMTGLAEADGWRYLQDFELKGQVVDVEVIGQSDHLDGAPRVAMLTHREGITQKVTIKLAGFDEPIVTTPEHPFWSVDRKGWVRAGSLAEGEQLRSDVHGTVRIETLSRVYDDRPVYNIEVTEHHNYFVGQAAVLVHNSEHCVVSVEADLPEGTNRQIKATESSHDMGVQLGRSFAKNDLGLRDAGWVNPLENGHVGEGVFGRGFDDVLEDANGNLVIMEYKGGPGSGLADGQMSRPWVMDVLNRMDDAQGNHPWTQKIREALEDGKLRGIAIKSVDSKSDTVVLLEVGY